MHESDVIEIVHTLGSLFREAAGGAMSKQSAKWWASELSKEIYDRPRIDATIRAMSERTSFLDPQVFFSCWNNLRRVESDKSNELRKSQERLTEMSVKDYWLSVDTCIDAMPQDEFDSLAAIALTELPDNIRERFSTKDLREIKSIRGRVFELYRTEQPA